MNEELDAFLREHPGVRHVEALLFDVAGRAIGKRLPIAQARKLWAGGMRLPPSNLLYDARGQSQSVMGVGYVDGDPDGVARAIPGTLGPVPWSPTPAAQVQVRLVEAATDEPAWWDPRGVLERVVARFAERGLTPVVACELEFYLVERTGDGALRPATSAAGPSLGGCYRFDKLEAYGDVLAAIDAACRAQAIPCGAATAEYSSTQFEINLDHVADAVRAADLALLQRRAVVGAARQAGLDATFMAKPFPEQAGSGLHVHVSVADAHGNIFDERRPDGEARTRAALGGLTASLYDQMAVFAPSLNSYRRFRPGVFAPMRANWGVENRSVALRIPGEGGASRRIEHRVAGADANPHLVLAAILDGMLEGLDKGLDPGPPTQGDAGAEPDPAFPRTLWRALDRFAASDAAARAFGRFREAYVELKTREAETLMDALLPHEQAWYG